MSTISKDIDMILIANSMLRIARLPKTKIGVVCMNQNTAPILKHILFGNHSERNIASISLEDPEKVKHLAEASAYTMYRWIE
jgi:hypothetical protein